MFFERPPSANWEQVPVPWGMLWVWFKPPQAPQGLYVRLASERGGLVTLRGVLHALAIDPRWVSVCYVYGHPLDAMQGLNPALDYPVPAPAPGADPTISILLHAAPPPVFAIPQSQPPYAAAAFAGPPLAAPEPGAAIPAGSDSAALFSRIEADWNAILLMENHQDAARKQLNGMQMRLNALNRDLNVEEARAADSADRVDWQEARRWLRDVAARVSRFIKEHDVGMTSNAGMRLRFESIYQDHVRPRRLFPGMEQAAREFEMHRKTMQHLLANMQTALSQAATDGEKRAQAVLSRIAAKVRTQRAKRGS